MKEDWWVGDKPGESPQDEPPAVLENDEILILKANSQWVNPLGIFIISFGASGYVTNTISELDFFPEPYLYYFGLFLSLLTLSIIGISSIWSLFNNEWSTIILDGDNVSLKRYRPLKISSFSYKQIKSTQIEVVVMEKVWEDTTRDDSTFDDVIGDSMSGNWSHKVKLLDSNGKKIAIFDLDEVKWKPFAEKISKKLNKKLIEDD